MGIRPRRVGVATGTRELAERPNVIRAILGEPLAGEGAGFVEVLETTIDDMNPQLYGHLTESLFESGASEVFLTPVQMKKGRPGVLVTALCDPRRSEAGNIDEGDPVSSPMGGATWRSRRARCHRR